MAGGNAITVIFAIVEMVRWGNKWGKKPHGLQPIPSDLDLAKTA